MTVSGQAGASGRRPDGFRPSASRPVGPNPESGGGAGVTSWTQVQVLDGKSPVLPRTPRSTGSTRGTRVQTTSPEAPSNTTSAGQQTSADDHGQLQSEINSDGPSSRQDRIPTTCGRHPATTFTTLVHGVFEDRQVVLLWHLR